MELTPPCGFCLAMMKLQELTYEFAKSALVFRPSHQFRHGAGHVLLCLAPLHRAFCVVRIGRLISEKRELHGTEGEKPVAQLQSRDAVYFVVLCDLLQ